MTAASSPAFLASLMASSTAISSRAGDVETSSSSPTSMSSSISSCFTFALLASTSPLLLPSSVSDSSSTSASLAPGLSFSFSSLVALSACGGGVRASVRVSDRSGPRGMASSTSMMRLSAVTMFKERISLGPKGTRPMIAVTESRLDFAFFSACTMTCPSPSMASFAEMASQRFCTCCSAASDSPPVPSLSSLPSPMEAVRVPKVRSAVAITRPQSSSSLAAASFSPEVSSSPTLSAANS
mmetsp:Transcript_31281/g.50264  ORF Transcript_31281/g.50264 Transcript_31281/m.50264 type:complete len:240 (-) Transcript_31281:421-1140(-)